MVPDVPPPPPGPSLQAAGASPIHGALPCAGTPFYVAAAMLLIGLILAQYATRSAKPAIQT
ncbi:hypothetical protein RBB75_07000 [Tunturibacter empetritectus]|uniref:IPTL-CTERM sorting domain-containing protein n=1 Tax=Tunturiibacter empetritectus TaxID=3069691 RepID=A0AAU7ZI99_9BACT